MAGRLAVPRPSGAPAAIRPGCDAPASARQRRRVLAQFGNRGRLPVPRAQPRAEVVQPIYRRAVARRSAGRRWRCRCRATAGRDVSVPLASSDCTSGSATRVTRHSGPVQLTTRSTSQARVRVAPRGRQMTSTASSSSFTSSSRPAWTSSTPSAPAIARRPTARRHAVAMHFPRRAHVPQETRALRVVERAPLRGELRARERQHFAPVAAGAVDRFASAHERRARDAASSRAPPRARRPHRA